MSENDEFWGPAIEVNGVCPEWLRATDLVDLKTSWGWRYSGRREPSGSVPKDLVWISSEGQPNILAIRLPADHPYYLATSKGYTYWPGGDEAPGDWDEEDILMRCGKLGHGIVWRYHRHSGDIIGYRKKQAEPVDPDAEAPLTENIWHDFANELYATARNTFQSAATVAEYREAFSYADLADEALRKAEKGEG